MKMPETLFVVDEECLIPFYQYVQSIFLTHLQNRTRIFDTECFIPFHSLCGVVGLPSWFTKFLIGTTVNI